MGDQYNGGVEMNAQMDTCYECKNTFDEDSLKKCVTCEVFVCRDCIQWCSDGIDFGLDNGSWDDDICGGEEGAILHVGCDIDQLEVCDCDRGIWGGKRCERTVCWNHQDSCMDCDSSRCGSCWISCESCYSSSCISSECGGSCDSCKQDFCEDHIRKCWDEDCSRMFCERCSDDKNNMKSCETCDGDFCVAHGEHECSVN